MCNQKMMIIGLDGATFDVIDPLIEEGVLPNIARLKNAGISASLTSVYPPVTGPAWVSLATGKNPGKTGVFDFFNRHSTDGHFQSITSTDFAGTTFWDLLSANGKRIGIFNYPMLYPAYPINGFMVGGLGSPINDKLTYPPELVTQLHRTAGGFEPELTLYNEPIYIDNEELFIKDLLKGFNKRIDILRYLLGSSSWDIFLTVLSASDFIQHYLWKHWDESHPQHKKGRSERYREEFKRLWNIIDGIVGEICRGLSEDANILLVSDHGFGPIDRCFYLNAWLARQGYLRGKRLYPFLEERIEPLARKMFPSIYSAGKKFLREELGIKRPFQERKIVRQKSRIVSLGANRLVGSILINGTDREQERLRDELVAALLAFNQDPEMGIEIEVKKPEEIYWGEKLARAPHLMINVKDFKGAIDNRNVSGKIVESALQNVHEATWVRNVTGHHRMNGMLIAKGPHIKQGLLDRADIIDIAPTVLFAFGFLPPADMDGRVLEIFSPDFLAQHPQRNSLLNAESGVEAYSRTEEEEKIVEEALKGLGYL